MIIHLLDWTRAFFSLSFIDNFDMQTRVAYKDKGVLVDKNVAHVI